MGDTLQADYDKVFREHFKEIKIDNYTYHGQWSDPQDHVIHTRYFPDKKEGTCIECGAFDGMIESNNLFFEKNYNWKCYNIEPLPHIFEMLEKIVKRQ